MIGTSAGGLKALKTIVSELPDDFTIPVIIVQHLNPQSDGFLAHYLNQLTQLTVKEVDAGEPILQKHIYIAPANYHVLVEKNESLSLTVSEKVNFARPSIDVLFESAADVFGNMLAGVLLTGANHDGSAGMKRIHELGGYTLAQHPDTAEVNVMPLSAIQLGIVDKVLHLNEFATELSSL